VELEAKRITDSWENKGEMEGINLTESGRTKMGLVLVVDGGYDDDDDDDDDDDATVRNIFGILIAE